MRKINKKYIEELMKIGNLDLDKLSTQIKLSKEELIKVIDSDDIDSENLILLADFFNVAPNSLLLNKEDITLHKDEYVDDKQKNKSETIKESDENIAEDNNNENNMVKGDEHIDDQKSEDKENIVEQDDLKDKTEETNKPEEEPENKESNNIDQDNAEDGNDEDNYDEEEFDEEYDDYEESHKFEFTVDNLLKIIIRSGFIFFVLLVIVILQIFGIL